MQESRVFPALPPPPFTRAQSIDAPRTSSRSSSSSQQSSIPAKAPPPLSTPYSFTRQDSSRSLEEEKSKLRQLIQSCSLSELKLLADKLDINYSGHPLCNDELTLMTLIENSVMSSLDEDIMSDQEDDGDGDKSISSQNSFNSLAETISEVKSAVRCGEHKSSSSGSPRAKVIKSQRRFSPPSTSSSKASVDGNDIKRTKKRPACQGFRGTTHQAVEHTWEFNQVSCPEGIFCQPINTPKQNVQYPQKEISPRALCKKNMSDQRHFNHDRRPTPAQTPPPTRQRTFSSQELVKLLPPPPRRTLSGSAAIQNKSNLSSQTSRLRRSSSDQESCRTLVASIPSPPSRHRHIPSRTNKVSAEASGEYHVPQGDPPAPSPQSSSDLIKIYDDLPMVQDEDSIDSLIAHLNMIHYQHCTEEHRIRERNQNYLQYRLDDDNSVASQGSMCSYQQHMKQLSEITSSSGYQRRRSAQKSLKKTSPKRVTPRVDVGKPQESNEGSTASAESDDSSIDSLSALKNHKKAQDTPQKQKSEQLVSNVKEFISQIS